MSSRSSKSSSQRIIIVIVIIIIASSSSSSACDESAHRSRVREGKGEFASDTLNTKKPKHRERKKGGEKESNP